MRPHLTRTTLDPLLSRLTVGKWLHAYQAKRLVFFIRSQMSAIFFAFLPPVFFRTRFVFLAAFSASSILFSGLQVNIRVFPCFRPLADLRGRAFESGDISVIGMTPSPAAPRPERPEGDSAPSSAAPRPERPEGDSAPSPAAPRPERPEGDSPPSSAAPRPEGPVTASEVFRGMFRT